MPFPPGWASIQSPFNVQSYTLSEHARWALLMVIISLFWLKEGHLKPSFVRSMKVVFTDEVRDGKSVPDIMTMGFARIVKSNALLTAPVIDRELREPDAFQDIILAGRRFFQQLAEAAALASGVARSAAAQKAMSRVGSMMPPSRAGSVVAGPSRARRSMSVVTEEGGDEEEALEVVASIEEDVAEDITLGQLSVAQKSVKYRQWAARPNVHAGLHYYEDLLRFSLPSLQMVLPGESKHK